MKNLLVPIAIVLMALPAKAQYGYRDGNRIGLTLGVTQLSLSASGFNTKPELGWVGGLAVRGNYYDNFSMIFGMQFTESSFSLETKTPILLKSKDVKYTLSGAQIRLILSYNVIKDVMSIDAGPVLQVNGKLRIKNDDKNNSIPGTALVANDITDITKVNGNFYFGLSAGNKRVRAIVCYQFGVNNILNNLNKDDDLKAKNNGDNFKGHIGILSGQILFNL